MGSTSYHFSTRGTCSANWNCCHIDGGRPASQALPSSHVLVPRTTPLLSALLPKPRSVSTKGLFDGSLGTGKISLSQSIDCALGHQFHRIFSGAVRDEVEIRGHRSAYVVSGPRLVVQALRKAACINPVILLGCQKSDKINLSAAILGNLGLWGKAIGKGMVEGWRGSFRRKRGGVVHDGNDDEWYGSEDTFERRGNVWTGSHLRIVKRTHDE